MLNSSAILWTNLELPRTDVMHTECRLVASPVTIELPLPHINTHKPLQPNL